MRRTTVATAVLLAAPLVLGTQPATAAPTSRVVVQSTGDLADAARAVRGAGGEVTRVLTIVDGVSATVPTHRLAAVSAGPGVLAVTPDSVVGTASTPQQDSGTGEPHAVLGAVGADLLQRYGGDGRGTTVALIDTGIADVPDLAGRVRSVRDPDDPSLDAARLPCVNFSGEPDCGDGYGHGTFIAGLVAGSGQASGGTYRGVAPAAQLVSVKIAGRTGAADVTKVLAAIQWVVSFREEHGIGVLNLSLGTDSDTDPRTDPLNRAVQRATAAGITVVVAAGNSGVDQADASRGTVFKPGDDPTVLTVGAVDDEATAAHADDRVPAFTSRGPTAQGLAKPDLAAPGAHLVSLRSPGSFVEQSSAGRGVVDQTYRRGSGSSFSTAVVSGLVAIVRQARPDWTPAQVKAALIATADPARLDDVRATGAGIAYGPAAVFAKPGGATGPERRDLTSVEQARGSVRVVVTGCSTVERTIDGRCRTGVQGESTSQGSALQRQTFDDVSYATDEWDPSTWYLSQWSGNDWLGNDWLGNDWLGNDWLGNDWLGDPEDESYGQPRRGSSWYGTSE